VRTVLVLSTHAARKAEDAKRGVGWDELRTQAAPCASDAFPPPFADGIAPPLPCRKARRAVIQPGGSIRDDENESPLPTKAGLAMVFTGCGTLGIKGLAANHSLRQSGGQRRFFTIQPIARLCAPFLSPSLAHATTERFLRPPRLSVEYGKVEASLLLLSHTARGRRFQIDSKTELERELAHLIGVTPGEVGEPVRITWTPA